MKSRLLLFMCLTFWLVGCKTRTVYVPVESKTESRDSIIFRDSIIAKEHISYIDSLVIKDSTVIVVDALGNVIRTELYREKDRYRELTKDYKELQSRYDSLLSVKNKTIQIPYPVEKELSRWQQFKMDVGGYAISLSVIASIIGLSYCVRWLIRRRK